MNDWRKLTPIIAGIYARNGVGCCFHIVLDEGNFDQSCLEFCARWARDHDCAPCMLAAPLFLLAGPRRVQRAAEAFWDRRNLEALFPAKDPVTVSYVANAPPLRPMVAMRTAGQPDLLPCKRCGRREPPPPGWKPTTHRRCAFGCGYPLQEGRRPDADPVRELGHRIADFYMGDGPPPPRNNVRTTYTSIDPLPGDQDPLKCGHPKWVAENEEPMRCISCGKSLEEYNAERERAH